MLKRPLSSNLELILQNSKIDRRNNRCTPGRAVGCLRKGSPFNSLALGKKEKRERKQELQADMGKQLSKINFCADDKFRKGC